MAFGQICRIVISYLSGCEIIISRIQVISLFFGFSIAPDFVPNQESGFKKLNGEQRPFKTGEKLSYILHYGIFNAGVAEITISSANKSLFGNRK